MRDEPLPNKHFPIRQWLAEHDGFSNPPYDPETDRSNPESLWHLNLPAMQTHVLLRSGIRTVPILIALADIKPRLRIRLLGKRGWQLIDEALVERKKAAAQPES